MEPERPILVAPDSFKGTFSAVEVADAIARGLERGGVAADRCPVADGGEGTLGVLIAALGGEIVRVPVRDPLGRPVEGELALLGGKGRRALLEMASASGLTLVAETEREMNDWPVPRPGSLSSSGSGLETLQSLPNANVAPERTRLANGYCRAVRSGPRNGIVRSSICGS